MSVKNELLKMIDERYQKFSKGQKKLADFIREDYDKAAFLTAAKMGEEVGVSESTVVRFATALDMTGIRSFRRLWETGADEAEFHPAYGSDVWADQQGRSLLRFCIQILRRSSLRWRRLIMRHLRWR